MSTASSSWFNLDPILALTANRWSERSFFRRIGTYKVS